MGGIWKPSGRARYRIWYKDHNGQRQTDTGYRDKQALNGSPYQGAWRSDTFRTRRSGEK